MLENHEGKNNCLIVFKCPTYHRSHLLCDVSGTRCIFLSTIHCEVYVVAIVMMWACCKWPIYFFCVSNNAVSLASYFTILHLLPTTAFMVLIASSGCNLCKITILYCWWSPKFWLSALALIGLWTHGPPTIISVEMSFNRKHLKWSLSLWLEKLVFVISGLCGQGFALNMEFPNRINPLCTCISYQ